MTDKEFLLLPSVRALSSYCVRPMTKLYTEQIQGRELSSLMIYNIVEDYAVSEGLYSYVPNIHLRYIEKMDIEKRERQIQKAHETLSRYIIVHALDEKRKQKRHERWSD